MATQNSLLELTESYLQSLFADAVGMAASGFDTSAPFGELGIDSFRVLKLIKVLEADFGRLPKTLLFERFNVGALAQYFVEQHAPALEARFASPVAAAAVQASPVPIATPSPPPAVQGPLRLLEADLPKHPALQALVQALSERHRNEGGVSRGTRNIAPNLFIGSARQGYFNYSRSGDTLLVYAYTGPQAHFGEIAQELHRHCVDKGFQLNIFTDQPLEPIDGVAFSATPFGALQRVHDLKGFTLDGGAMRRLRYQVQKFEKAGACRTVEYACGSDPAVDRDIARVIDRWCETKAMVNPLIHIVRGEILAGALHAQHRIFLTSLDDVLQNVILVSRMSAELNGYLMDLEFYPRDMPLGGLEYAIVKIVEALAAEGCDLLSLGGTYGCRLEAGDRADPEVDKLLDDLHAQKIFNDEGNLQFKNKFRPENRTIYLCRPVGSGRADNVIDIIMMIADPARAQTSDEANHNVAEARVPMPAPVAAGEALLAIDGEPRSRALAEAGFNPLNLPSTQVDHDLKTDSWAQLEGAFVERRMKHLRAQLQQPARLDESLRAIFPFRHVVLTESGRASDRVLCKAWPRRGIVLQNLLFPTCIYHQIDNGFTPVEIPGESLFATASDAPYKGDLSIEALRAQLAARAAEIAYVCIEVADNAAGGQPVSLHHLKEVRALLAPHAIPLVIDSTRVLENARWLIEHEPEHAGQTLWEVAAAILSQADVAIGALAKDFCIDKGGVLATNDESLLRRFQDVIRHEGGGLDVIDRKLVALSLADRPHIEAQVLRKMRAARSIWQALAAAGVPVLHPAGGHCVLVDVKRIPEFAGFENPVGSFLAWLYLNTGIRAGLHSVGMQNGTPLNGVVRFAVPVGLKQEEADDIAARLVRLFGEKKNIPELAAGDAVADLHARFALRAWHRPSGAVVPIEAAPVPTQVPVSPPQALAASTTVPPRGDIAVVGMAGRYPQARTLAEFWTHLRDGRDCITEIPEERMRQRADHALTRRYRGGFIDQVDRFDSLFFNISPREAEALDPQERLFLEVAWEALEDAGYHPEILSQDKAPRRVGVFVGAVWAMYQMVGAEQKLAGRDLNPNSFLWSIANRVSWWMNLSGPSLTVDTACSSSLTALHLACEAIHNGECASALVGGVNLDLHQHKFDINRAGGALSSDGVCRSFGTGANGYVAGEGVGALYLKPLAQALEDRDQVYGVIKGIAVNHGGRTSGYTVPNPKAQGDLVAAALARAGVAPRDIGYIEAHGTGTELGDPVEIAGLGMAFQGDAGGEVALQSCPVGSVKTNIGHLEAAAGVAGVCKVLLQMKHRQLVPSLHSARLNEHIDFAQTPFRVQQQLQDWTAAIRGGVAQPLRAGVSSFGAGGANAHVVLESLLRPAETAAPAGLPTSPLMFPLSARNGEQLREMAARLRDHLQGNTTVPAPLADVAFTLQHGRKSFEHRLVVIASTLPMLVDKLGLFVDGLEGSPDADVLTGHAKNADGLTKLLDRREREQFVALLAERRDPHKLAQLWIDGLLPDWPGLSQTVGRRTSLPTYPFADKRHWIGASEVAPAPGAGPARLAGLHPLIDSNESTFSRQVFRKTFLPHEFFVRDHVVSGVPTLPGTAYLELARKAGEVAAGMPVASIRNVTWVSPLTVEEGRSTTAFIELKPSGDSVPFEVYSEPADGGRRLHAQGRLVYAAAGTPAAAHARIDLAAVRARCSGVIDAQQAYPLFSRLGMVYGPSFQVLHQVRTGAGEVLGELRVPPARSADFDAYGLHPSLLDAAMQAGVMAQLNQPAGEMIVPYSIGEVEFVRPLTRTCYSHLTTSAREKGGVSREHVTIVDEVGEVLVRIRDAVGVPLASLHQKPVAPKGDEGFAELYYAPAWKAAPLPAAKPDLRALLVYGLDETLQRACIERGLPATLVLPGEAFEDLGGDRYRIRPRSAEDHARLLDTLARHGRLPDKVCYAWAETAEPVDAAALDRALASGVEALLLFCQALIEQKPAGRIQLACLAAWPDASAAVPPHVAAVHGFVRSLRLENPKIDAKVLDVLGSATGACELLDTVVAELHTAAQDDIAVRHIGGTRHVRTLERLDAAAFAASDAGLGLKQRGVYLITGGAGGLGLVFAEDLARRCQARLVLTGRSALPAAREARLEQLRALGAEVLYVAADVSRADDVRRVLAETRDRFGRLDGIVHGAGVLRDSLLRRKTADELAAVLAPKVHGSFHLDAQTAGDDLDFFVCFSSLAAIGGNAGQCDYAYANHWMDSFAARREAQRAAGLRRGRTLSLNWSLWAEGGMQLDAPTEAFFRKNLGIRPLATEVGLRAFRQALALDRPQVAVLEGVRDKIEAAWGLAKKETAAAQPAPAAPEASVAGRDDLADAVIRHLSTTVMAMLKIGADDLQLDSVLLDLGFDSIGLTTLANAINETYRLDLNPVMFFEHPSIRAIAGALVAEHGDAVRKVHAGAASAPPANRAAAAPAPASAAVPIGKGWTAPAPSNRASPGLSQESRFVDMPIAIVGMGGTMPQSDSLEAFWDHLRNARNLVTEIPRDRWTWEDYDGNPQKEPNTSYSRWGGFMKEVDKFDPLFFGITPREAEMMDPQQRLFIEAVWHAIEDAGHKVSDLSGTRTGVFVGASSKDYIDVLAEQQVMLDGFSASGNSHSILPNRISYLLNLRGPSAPLDTACSSSLVALHRAIESIHTGSSDMAIVGGVQVMLTPIGHVSLSSAGMLSPDGKCKTFDKGANGYVRGEGVGAILIKPLAQAERDGDPIHAVIRATSENHGGRVTMLTAPNPKAQAELLVEAYTKARIDPATVGYIECHGTGTSLGDPIEIQALKKAFGDLYQQHGHAAPPAPHCGLSSVKTNIGHLEPAAGMASLFKVLLAMKHREIPAMLHFEALNPYIDLKGSPFHIVDRTQAWPAPLAADGRELPRRAGVSSFGWGGANAHVVLEEYVPPARAAAAVMPAQLVVLSARNEDRLKACAAALLAHVRTHEFELADLAWTLQAGRDAMDCRLAMVVDSRAALIERLQAQVDGSAGRQEGVFVGRVARQRAEAALPDMADLAGVAEAWVLGGDMALPLPQAGPPPQRLRLPGYPFARERHWVQAMATKATTKPAAAAPAAIAQAQPAERLIAVPRWEVLPSANLAAPADPSAWALRETVFCGMPHVVLELLRSLVPGMAAVHLAPSADAGLADRYREAALSCFERIQAILKDKPKAPVLFQVVIGHEGPDAVLAGLSGLLRSARLESAHLVAQLVVVEADAAMPGQERVLADLLQACAARPDDVLFRQEAQGLGVQRWRARPTVLPAAAGAAPALRADGVYLITGGLGGLGLLFARDILERAPGARVIVTGRGPLDAAKQATLARVAQAASATPAQLAYEPMGLTQRAEVDAVVGGIVRREGGLHGVIHAAGTTRDSLVVKKRTDDFLQVLEPKVAGTMHLDLATQGLGLDFIALFSSVSAALGNAGQADYAAANGFMDQFAAYRNKLVAAGLRRGHTVSLNWPLWEEGGMQIDARAQALLLKASGMVPLRSATGLQAFHQVLALRVDQALVMEGRRERLDALLGLPARTPSNATTTPAMTTPPRTLRDLVLADLRSLASGGN